MSIWGTRRCLRKGIRDSSEGLPTVRAEPFLNRSFFAQQWTLVVGRASLSSVWADVDQTVRERTCFAAVLCVLVIVE